MFSSVHTRPFRLVCLPRKYIKRVALLLNIKPNLQTTHETYCIQTSSSLLALEEVLQKPNYIDIKQLLT